MVAARGSGRQGRRCRTTSAKAFSKEGHAVRERAPSATSQHSGRGLPAVKLVQVGGSNSGGSDREEERRVCAARRLARCKTAPAGLRAAPRKEATLASLPVPKSGRLLVKPVLKTVGSKPMRGRSLTPRFCSEDEDVQHSVSVDSARSGRMRGALKGILRKDEEVCVTKCRSDASRVSRVSFCATVAVREIKFADLQYARSVSTNSSCDGCLSHGEEASPTARRRRPRSCSNSNLDTAFESSCGSSFRNDIDTASSDADGSVNSRSPSSSARATFFRTRARTRSYADAELEEEINAYCPDLNVPDNCQFP